MAPRRQAIPKKKRRPPKKDPSDVWGSGRWNRAVRIESQMLSALEAFTHSIGVLRQNTKGDGRKVDVSLPSYYPISFPGIRECNSALATFGDGGDLLRALRLFGKMRKAEALFNRYKLRVLPPVPAPTLVTYSTIMSRAVRMGKPRVALRLWNLMTKQRGFFINNPSPASTIVPDIKAANILMNCYAKLGDVTSARDLLNQMLKGNGRDVPYIHPNLVTYNTLLDACHKGEDLDTALEIKEQIDGAGLIPDTRTYTTLIATVARKASASSGAHDPTPAFSLHQEMKARDVRPNGMTYSALIDVCARCSRSDLALKVLRIMLHQKAQERRELGLADDAKFSLPSEVGAWTAAIDACGKSGRLDTAIRLFYSMPKFGEPPNAVTCGCLTNCLLNHGRTAETLDVLRYMKQNNIAPTEVMYTSLMTSAGRLVQFENQQQNTRNTGTSNQAREHAKDLFPVDESGETKAIEVYTELIMSLTQGNGPRDRSRRVISQLSDIENRDATLGNEDSDELLKVFLVFQEMKNVGANPDLACYNALLRTCARAGDVRRAEQVMDQILNSDDVEPNDSSFRSMIRAAGKARRSDVAMTTWRTALQSRRATRWKPSVDTFSALIAALMNCASDPDVDNHTRRGLRHLVINLYSGVMSGANDRVGMGMHLVDKDEVLQNSRLMCMVLEAAVEIGSSEVQSDGQRGRGTGRQDSRALATSLLNNDCFKRGLPQRFLGHPQFSHAYEVAHSWANEMELELVP